MTNFQDLVIAPMNAVHDRTAFHCNEEALGHYIRKQAGQDIKRKISRIFVATQPDNPKKILGYYSLSSLSIELHHLPEKLAQKLPKHSIPAALIGRLAVSNNAQGYGIGKMLIVDAIKRTLSISEQIAIYAMIVNVINDKAKDFYEQFGFARLSNNKSRLFLPLKTLPKIL